MNKKRLTIDKNELKLIKIGKTITTEDFINHLKIIALDNEPNDVWFSVYYECSKKKYKYLMRKIMWERGNTTSDGICGIPHALADEIEMYIQEL